MHDCAFYVTCYDQHRLFMQIKVHRAFDVCVVFLIMVLWYVPISIILILYANEMYTVLGYDDIIAWATQWCKDRETMSGICK